jgi:hypothetical protein
MTFDQLRKPNDFMWTPESVDLVCTEIAARAKAKQRLGGRVFVLYLPDAAIIHTKVSKKFSNTWQNIQALVRKFPQAELPLQVSQIEELPNLVASVAKVFGVRPKVLYSNAVRQFRRFFNHYPGQDTTNSMDINLGHLITVLHFWISDPELVNSRLLLSMSTCSPCLSIRP